VPSGFCRHVTHHPSSFEVPATLFYCFLFRLLNS
jgi:hypothetical protein